MPEEIGTQHTMRLRLLAALAGGDPQMKADPAHRAKLRLWVESLPVTGRLRIASAEAAWLEANPRYNPVLTPGSTVTIPSRPKTVTVVMADGELCRVVHRSGHEAKSYVEACRGDIWSGADWAWIAQPDGTVQRVGVALWNASQQDEPAPGAWIWAPPRNTGWPESFSEEFARFLATQGVAPDTTPEPGSARLTPPAEPKVPGGESVGLKLSPDLGLASPGQEPAEQRTPTEPISLQTAAPEKSRDPYANSSDWGSVGLLQTPTARMRPAGGVSSSYSRTYPYSRGNLFAQPLDWLEVGFRYTTISNRLYSQDPNFSGDQSFKDKSIDIKLRAWKESAYIPEIAVGFIDIAGTGLFSSEYVVGSKRTGNFDWSLGIGWGYLAGTGDMRNPLSKIFGDKFDTRKNDTGQGGNFSFGSYFHGRASMFGGVQYQTPWEPLLLKLEYEGNDYQSEPQLNNQKQDTRFNFGILYRPTKWADLTLALERGNKVTFGISLHTQLNQLAQVKSADPAPVPVPVAWPEHKVDWLATNRDVERQTDWQVSSIVRQGNEMRLTFEDANATYWRYRIDRAIGVLHRDAPPEIDKFVLKFKTRGADVAEHVVDRQAWVTERTQALPPTQQQDPIISQAPQEDTAAGKVLTTDTRKPYQFNFGLNFSEVLGGPDAFLLYQLSAGASGQYRFRDDTWIQGVVRYNLANNYDKFKVTGPSNLPRVRTFQREYLTTSDLTMPNLQLTHVGKFGRDSYYSVYGGYLEEMFAGVGGEWLYRPFGNRFAFGVDVNGVKQREFSQGFGFLEPSYQTMTGHATLYWETGWNDVNVRVHAGRYLAGDYGATLDVSRVFRNGIVLGAFATKTNVSAEEFGEGSFDKGVYLRIPFDILLPRSTSSFANVLWRPVTRDGGQMLGRSVQLYGMTRLRSERALDFEAPPLPNEMRPPPQQVEHSVMPAKVDMLAAVRAAAPAPVAQWQKDGSMEQHRLAEALYNQQFRNVKVMYDASQRLIIEASHPELYPTSRAVGRIARLALLQAPVEAREITITFHQGATVQARYEFADLARLRRYFEGEIGADELRDYVKVTWMNPAARERDALAQLRDLSPATPPTFLAAAATVVPETFSVSRVTTDIAAAAQNTRKVDWLSAGALGVGLFFSGSSLDNRALRWAQEHASSSWLDKTIKVGDALPFIGMGLAGLAAIDGSDPVRSRTGWSALEAGTTGAVAATGLKMVFGRARPKTGLGNKEFTWFTTDDAFGSFPSVHTTVAWAVATPFALEYDMPWLYGVAAITNLARIGAREHWVSDTFVSSLLGYGVGRLFWQGARDQTKGDPTVYFNGTSVGLKWAW